MLVILKHPEQETNPAFHMEQFLDFGGIYFAYPLGKSPWKAFVKGRKNLEGDWITKTFCLLNSSGPIRFVTLNELE